MEPLRAACVFPQVAVSSSWMACRAGMPYGGCYAWLLVVICANDSGDYPWAPPLAAILGWPITLICDTLLLPATLAFRLAAACSRRGADDAATAADAASAADAPDAS